MNRSLVKTLFVLLVVLSFASAAFFLPLASYILDMVTRVREAGALGALLFGAMYAVATVFMIPGSLLTLLAGFLYGLVGGVLVVWPASLVGATLAFWVGRFVARDWVQGFIRERPRARAVDRAVGDQAFTIIFLLRLSPVLPFTLLNYVLGVTRARLSQYFWASATGMLPGTVLYVYLGSLATDAAALASGDRPSAGVWGTALLVVGLLATAAVTVAVSRMASARLRAELDAEEPGSDA